MQPIHLSTRRISARRQLELDDRSKLCRRNDQDAAKLAASFFCSLVSANLRFLKVKLHPEQIPSLAEKL
jgi:hypothetical protein